MVVVNIEEVIAMVNKLKEINESRFQDLLFVTKGGRKTGVIVVKLDSDKVAKYTKLEPISTLITSGDWMRYVMEGK